MGFEENYKFFDFLKQQKLSMRVFGRREGLVGLTNVINLGSNLAGFWSRLGVARSVSHEDVVETAYHPLESFSV